MRFLGHYNIPWIFQWSFTIGNKDNCFILTRELFYKWWPKFEYSNILKEIKKDISIYEDYNQQVEHEEKLQRNFKIENQEFRTPTITSLKKMYPTASPQEIKKKMMRALASQLDQLNDEDFMSTSSATPSATQDKTESLCAENEEDEDINLEILNEDMEDYMGSWLNQLEKPDKDKEKGKKPEA